MTDGTESFLSRWISRFTQWMERPVTLKDRVISSLLGLWAGLWIGGLGSIIFIEPPIASMTVVYAALGGSLLCFIAGLTIPKYSMLLFFPFSFVGISGN